MITEARTSYVNNIATNPVHWSKEAADNNPYDRIPGWEGGHYSWYLAYTDNNPIDWQCRVKNNIASWYRTIEQNNPSQPIDE